MHAINVGDTAETAVLMHVLVYASDATDVN